MPQLSRRKAAELYFPHSIDGILDFNALTCQPSWQKEPNLVNNNTVPLFTIAENYLAAIEITNFETEKKLQSLVEKNLKVLFNCRLVATEFPTGAQHAGRIDTLALSEDNNPVIIEYKKIESSDLINQSLFYLSWIHDHRGDFELVTMKALGKVDVDWSDVRVICIAPNYKKYDLHAVQVMGANIELWTYRLFKNSSFYIEEVFRKSLPAPSSIPAGGAGLSPGKKAALTRATGSYTFKQHLEGKPEAVKKLALLAQEFILGLDPAIEESPKKLYVAYKLTQNIVCVQLYKKVITLYVKLNPKELGKLPPFARDVTEIGHFGTGDLELSVGSEAEFEVAKQFIALAYRKMGG
jgi:predicted transport protein